MQVAEITNHNGLIYQPIPFEEYKDIKSERNDSEERYQTIKKNYGDFKDKSLIDICCANGYFMFRFMQDGGRLAKGIEIRREIMNFVNILAIEKNMDISCNIHLNGLKSHKFDIGIYLDTHYAIGTEGYLEYLQKHIKTLFTSSAHKESGNTNEEYKGELRKLFKSVLTIYTGFAGRTIFKCA
jgi:2-polyprenyl-3-methyl-5-hydroxy-6-metoxy-1,4-benzoquinol methylase